MSNDSHEKTDESPFYTEAEPFDSVSCIGRQYERKPDGSSVCRGKMRFGQIDKLWELPKRK